MRWLQEDAIAAGIFKRWDGLCCNLGQIMNQVGDGDGSCVKATEQGEFLT